MSRPATVAASTFARCFAHYQDEAIREKVIVVTSHDGWWEPTCPPTNWPATSG